MACTTVYKGYHIVGDNMADLENKIRQIDRGKTDGFRKYKPKGNVD